jgi:CheY-like chemotaxis protein
VKKVLIVSSSEENITQLRDIFGGEGVVFHSIKTMRLALPLYAQQEKFDLAFLDDEFGDVHQLIVEVSTF